MPIMLLDTYDGEIFNTQILDDGMPSFLAWILYPRAFLSLTLIVSFHLYVSNRNVVHRSKHILDHLNPYWDPITISLEELCYGDLSCPLKVSVLDHEPNGKHRLIGEFETTIQMLIDRISQRGNADRDRAFEIFKTNDLTKSYGLVVVVKADLQLDEEPSEGMQQLTQQQPSTSVEA